MILVRAWVRSTIGFVGLSLSVAACGGATAGSGTEALSRQDGGKEGSSAALPDARPEPASQRDAGPEPPEYCVPPCVWRVILACTPPPATVCREKPPPEPAAAKVLCDPASGWFRTEANMSSAGTVISYGHDGQTCFTIRFGGKAPGVGLRIVTDGTNDVADYGVSPRVVRCPDDRRDYSLDPSRPECAPWTGPDGAGMVQPALECESIVPGTCDTAP